MHNGSIIIIGGGSLQVPLIRSAKEDLNLRTIVFDQNPDAPGSKFADHFYKVSTMDAVLSAETARGIQNNSSEEAKIRAVITAGTDASYTVAVTAQSLNLPGIFPESALAASDKLIMRNHLKEAGVPVPAFSEVTDLQNLKFIYNKLKSETGSFLFVIKPSRNMGARGVRLIRSESELDIAFRFTRQYSDRGTILLEEFMEGPELSADCLIWTKIKWKDFINLIDKNKFINDFNYRKSIFDQYVHIEMTGLADRIIRHPPYFIEPGHNMPADQPENIQKEALNVMRHSAAALGIFTGAAKGDLKVTPQGIKVGEVAARLSGGYMSSHTFPIHSGINLYKNAILIALGENPENLTPVKNRVVIERCIPFTLNQDNPELFITGKITEFSLKDDIRRIPGIEYFEFTKKTGDILRWPESNMDKAGHIIASGNTLQEAEAAAKKAWENIILKTDNSYTFSWKEIEEKAKSVLPADICHVCRVCDGKHCASGVPGMGAAGKMNSFKNNSDSLSRIRILPSYFENNGDQSGHTDHNSLNYNFFNKNLKFPVMPAPLTGVATNMGAFTSEKDFARSVMRGAIESGSVMWFGDGADPEKYKDFLDLIEESEGRSVIILKPRCDTDEIKKRIRESEERGVLAAGFDIDSVGLKTMVLKNQAVCRRSADQWKRIRDFTKLPFIIKGILTIQDALAAIETGADAIVVSNHGGRILDDLPGSAEVLKEITDTVSGRIRIIADGGIRSGSDVYKMLALGAESVLIGRPMVTAVAGAGHLGVKRYFTDIYNELEKIYKICGEPDYNKIKII